MSHNIKEIRGFTGEYQCLSIFYPCIVIHGDLVFCNAEAAFQAAKSMSQDERIRFCAMTSAEAKREGWRVEMRPDWKQVKVDVMRDILLSKFERNADLWLKLLGTGDAILVEDNAWHDNFWGNCICERCRETPGQNMLGKLLMKIRDTYKYYWRS